MQDQNSLYANFNFLKIEDILNREIPRHSVAIAQYQNSSNVCVKQSAKI